MAIKNNVKVIRAVAEASRINREIKENMERLNELKSLIREEAERVCVVGDDGKPEKVEFESPEGVATVSFPKERVAFIKGANPVALKEVLPEAVWNGLFDTKVVFGDLFEDAFRLLPRAQQKAIKVMVEWKESTPTVTLPK